MEVTWRIHTVTTLQIQQIQHANVPFRPQVRSLLRSNFKAHQVYVLLYITELHIWNINAWNVKSYFES